MSYKTIWIVLIVCMIIAIAVYNNMTNHKNKEGFSCAVEKVLTNTLPPNTGIVMIQYLQLFVTFEIVDNQLQNVCTTKMKDYDVCNAGSFPDINISYMNNTSFKDNKTTLMKYISVLTKMYNAIDVYTPVIMTDSNSFTCKCYNYIMQNFYDYYISERRYNSSDIKTYHSIVRFFFDVVDPTLKKVYTGMGDYDGTYNKDYYTKFIVVNANDINAPDYAVPDAIQNEPVDLMNSKYEYNLNVFSEFLLSNSNKLTDEESKTLRNSTLSIFNSLKSSSDSTIDKETIQYMIKQIAHLMRYKYNKMVKTPYNILKNVFPGNTISNEEGNISKIIKKIRNRTFMDSDPTTLCSGGDNMTDNTINILNDVVDRKYFVSYLKAVINAIKSANQSQLSGASDSFDISSIVDTNNLDSHNSVLLQSAFQLSSNQENIYNTMEYFGTFDKRTNRYILNDVGLSIIKQMSIEEQSCVVDYLERMSILIFTPVKYGGTVNYDRWMFFK